MKTSKFSARAWLKGLTTTPQIADRDQLADARLLKAIEVRIEANRTRRRRWFAGISIGSILMLTTVGVATAFTRAETAKGDSSVGAMCWSGQFQNSDVAVIGRDIDPIERCMSIWNSQFRRRTNEKDWRGCVSESGVIHIFRNSQKCATYFMKNLNSDYSYTSIEPAQVQAMTTGILRSAGCLAVPKIEAQLFNGLENLKLPNWKVEVTASAMSEKCVYATVDSHREVVVLIPGASK